MMYDSECYELAQHFLPNGNEMVWDALAQEIQETVERWCKFDERSPEFDEVPF